MLSQAAEHVDRAVAGGVPAAMALVCLLQYAYHLYRMVQVKGERERYRRQAETLSGELQTAQRDEALGRLENEILREFVTQTNVDRAVDILLTRYVPDPGSGFGALVEIDPASGRTLVSRSRGLTAFSQKSLELSAALLERTARERLVTLEGGELLDSGLLGRLSSEDRPKASRLYLAGVGGGERPIGVFITTELHPFNADAGQQYDLLQRLTEKLAENFGRSLPLAAQSSRHAPRAVSHACEVNPPPADGTRSVPAAFVGDDKLNELARRREFDVRLNREIELARETGADCAVLLLDIDRFQTAGGTRGMEAGDAILTQVAAAVQDALMNVRSGDRWLAARYADDEFAVLLPGIGSAGAVRIGEAVRSAIEKRVFQHGGEKMRLTASLGAAVFPDHAASAEELLAAATDGLSRAKTAGRNRVCVVPLRAAEGVPA